MYVLDWLGELLVSGFVSFFNIGMILRFLLLSLKWYKNVSNMANTFPVDAPLPLY